MGDCSICCPKIWSVLGRTFIFHKLPTSPCFKIFDKHILSFVTVILVIYPKGQQVSLRLKFPIKADRIKCLQCPQIIDQNLFWGVEIVLGHHMVCFLCSSLPATSAFDQCGGLADLIRTPDCPAVLRETMDRRADSSASHQNHHVSLF